MDKLDLLVQATFIVLKKTCCEKKHDHYGYTEYTKASLGVLVYFSKGSSSIRRKPLMLRQNPLRQFSSLIEIRGNHQREVVFSGRVRCS